MTELSEVIKKLSQQVNVDALSTKDLVKELEELYSKVETLEGNNKEQAKRILELSDENSKIKLDIIPTNELKTREEDLETNDRNFKEEKFKFDLEKEYITRDNNRLGEVLSAVLASKTTSWYGNNGENITESVNKPQIQPLTNRSNNLNQ